MIADVKAKFFCGALIPDRSTLPFFYLYGTIDIEKFASTVSAVPVDYRDEPSSTDYLGFINLNLIDFLELIIRVTLARIK